MLLHIISVKQVVKIYWIIYNEPMYEVTEKKYLMLQHVKSPFPAIDSECLTLWGSGCAGWWPQWNDFLWRSVVYLGGRSLSLKVLLCRASTSWSGCDTLSIIKWSLNSILLSDMIVRESSSTTSLTFQMRKRHAPPGNRTRVARMGILHDTTTPAAPCAHSPGPWVLIYTFYIQYYCRVFVEGIIWCTWYIHIGKVKLNVTSAELFQSPKIYPKNHRYF